MPIALVLAGGVAFSWVSITNAAHCAPQWSQDLAFFHQWVHSAANGGPWASPLILEPQGFFQQVHTHLMLPLVVGLYTAIPSQSLLLALHSFVVACTVWPAFRLAERAGGCRHALFVSLALLAFGPFQAVAVADFRPIGLVIPAVTGIWLAAHKGCAKGAVAFSILALLARQDAVYLVGASGAVLTVLPWGENTRRVGMSVASIGVAGFIAFALLKPEMFFHINLTGQSTLPTGAELWANRASFGLAFLLSGWWVGVLTPAPLLAAMPVLWGMMTTGREWHILTGPGAHHHAFWLPFVVVAATVAAARVPKRFGGPLLLVLGWLAFPHPTLAPERPDLERLIQAVPSDARVAADYDTIHRFSGRAVLWNIDQLYVEERPRHWTNDWPLTSEMVDVVVAPHDHALVERLSEWHVVHRSQSHVVLRQP